MAESRFESLLCNLLSTAVREPELAAHALVVRYGDMVALAAADYDELSAMEHVGASGAYLLRLTFALRSRRVVDSFPLPHSFTEAEFHKYLAAVFFDSSNEQVCVFLVDDRGRVAFSEILGVGTVNSMSVLPRKILELSVRRNCRRVILAHNHPAGIAKASEDDIIATQHIARTLRDAHRELVAHYVVAGNEVLKIT